jgi:hypothetical protein
MLGFFYAITKNQPVHAVCLGAANAPMTVTLDIGFDRIARDAIRSPDIARKGTPSVSSVPRKAYGVSIPKINKADPEGRRGNLNLRKALSWFALFCNNSNQLLAVFYQI